MPQTQAKLTGMLLAGLVALQAGSHAVGQEWLIDSVTKTLGGPMIFTDHVIYQGWRVQKNEVLGSYRLLDPGEHRYTMGSLDHCLIELEKVKIEEQLPPLPKRVVVMVHGHGSARLLMGGLADHLRQNGGLYIVNFGYSSTSGDISQHAAALLSVLGNLKGVERVDFVAHSLGNIVVRHCLRDIQLLPQTDRPHIGFGRFVMIAPPNHGAVAADKLGDSKLVQWLGGDAVEQLAPSKGWPALEQHLATPWFEFGILVGGKGDGEGYLSAIPGDDDMMLSVETCKLAGATDIAQAKGIHQKLPDNQVIQQCTLRYLQTGGFLQSGVRTPIPAQPVKVVPL